MGEQLDSPKSVSITETKAPCQAGQIKLNRALATGLTTTLLFCVLLSVWLFYDKHVPTSDEANHVMNGMTYADLLQHARPFRAAWWQKFFTVNTYYPPVGTLVMGIFLAAIKDSVLALQLAKLFWIVILSLSVGLIAFIVAESSTAVLIAITVVNSCIIVCDFSHSSLIDQPLVSMVAFGLAAVIWKGGSASTPKSIAAGTILGLAIMTKQVAIAFLGFPIVIGIGSTLKRNGLKKALKSTLLLMLPLALICLPWTTLNFNSMQQLNAEIAADLAKRGTPWDRIKFNIEYYLESWVYCASPLVFLSSLVGLFACTKEQHKKLAILWASMLPAAAALCLISCQPARDRYLAPIVVLIAISAGIGLAQLKKRSKAAFLVCLAFLSPINCLQFLSFNFCPYPISDQAWLTSLAPSLTCKLREHVSPFFDRLKNIVYADHIPPNNEGGQLAIKILECISAQDSKLASWLNITAISGGLDVHEMELLAKLRGLPIKPTTSRLWTALGDKEVFSEELARHCRWYIIKEGDQGFRFANKESEEAHEKLIAFVKRSYNEVETFTALDGTQLSLYCAR
ncbi:MAG: hypothetical protein Q8T09_06590 [Candidatus Melainabacteria bacterium]|nr:hypothetical protein [Candidatus Melainabacteria bacterium]